ncbi:hypothetical protein ATHL_00753 [Anaerolinea thermolimosa]|uniref:hypothetical protein n=1 Tax=Anaerolinea thermolimosa TaxID=229919 RepID=UPI0007801DD9|nr:hypothetical protein [Anaerolinea thermolimosa]GAP05912.1 hypothetical protein ATHL_00753 [Anaerolinea thermolimosa]
MRTETDFVFRLAEVRDPFAVEDPFLLAFMALPPKQRRWVARQTILLCAAVDGLDTLGALELLARIAPFAEANRH